MSLVGLKSKEKFSTEKFSTVKKRPHSIKCTKTTSTLRKATKMAWLNKSLENIADKLNLPCEE